MTTFGYARANTVEEARQLLGGPDAVPLGGGTDLLVAIRQHIVNARLLVDLRGVDNSSSIQWRNDGSARIGASVRVSALAAHDAIRERFPALASACESVGTTALRNMGTLGGNLCQRPRCWYFRRAIPCFKNGGTSCPAASGQNQYHAILGGGPCHIVHPSDPAVALSALDASVEVSGPSGTRSVALQDFYVLPAVRLDGETVLGAGEFVSGVEIPPTSSSDRQCYIKLMQRGAWDFALASIAAVRRADGAVRMVLGGVAPVPWRINPSVEEDIASGSLSPEDFATLAERAMYDARPLSKNAYKVQLAKTLLVRAMEFLTQ